MTEEKIELLDEVISDLMGTCSNLKTALDNQGISEDDQEALEYIDGEIFLCSECGWWCENYERNSFEDEDICDDCYRVYGEELD